MKTLYSGWIATAFLLTTAFAKDSLWLLGDDGKIAVSAFEHRNESGDGRETNVTLILGAHFLQGKLVDVDSGKITLKESGGDSYKFKGTIAIDYQATTAVLKGVLFYAEADTEGDPIDTKISCKEMQ